ncbi:hypothetical protein DFH09DRAFT_1444786 [Mycena vulgaris]|nr:hypothetical protein DFH09DRAFT_1444786 [Mycena vulgaris]
MHVAFPLITRARHVSLLLEAHALLVSESLRRVLAESARARHDAALILRQLAAADRVQDSAIIAQDKSTCRAKCGGAGRNRTATDALPSCASPHQRPTNARPAPYAIHMLTFHLVHFTAAGVSISALSAL